MEGKTLSNMYKRYIRIHNAQNPSARIAYKCDIIKLHISGQNTKPVAAFKAFYLEEFYFKV